MAAGVGEYSGSVLAGWLVATSEIHVRHLRRALQRHQQSQTGSNVPAFDTFLLITTVHQMYVTPAYYYSSRRRVHCH